MIKVTIPAPNGSNLLDYLRTDEAGLALASEWKRLIQPYTPRDTNTMDLTAVIQPFGIRYTQPYSHYQYTGVLYVDPVYNIGAFYSSDYGFWSRPDVKKVPSDRMLNYQKNNPFSTDHWDFKAAEAGQLDKLAQTMINKLL